MSSPTPPGLPGQRGSRTGLRVLGPVLRLGAGGFPVVISLGLLNAGFFGAQARYAAGETMPVVKDSATYLSDGQGIMGVGRTSEGTSADRTGATGPYCRGCGVRNDEDARFCDGCGNALA